MSEPLQTRRAEGASAVTEAAREANERIATKALRLRFLARVPFICECSDGDCREFVCLLPQEYADARSAGAYVTLPGHAITGAEAVAAGDHWLHTTRGN